MLRSVAVLAVEGLPPFEFGVACEVFGIDRRDTGGPAFDFRVVTARPGRVKTSLGFEMVIERGLEEARGMDLVVVPAHGVDAVEPEYLEFLRRVHAEGAIILSICSGAFTLAATGLLDGRRAATHWMHADTLHERYPLVSVDPDVLYVDEGSIVTSAGTSAGIDACLHIVRRELGVGAANAIARRMVIPAQRDGGQAQFIGAPIAERCSDSLAAVMDWMLENLDRELTVDELARRALMSPRTFARRFRADVGTTPGAWLNRQRLLRAQHLLEATDDTLEAIAGATGFGSAAVLRHHFARVLQTTPTAYRRAFGERQLA
ncbi:transcriptional regulator GlxA family with amidase domain [Frondihabitans sp. PhB188]|uniref:helix-turn-helix domain-containing protein n=1 Tax=Frondihabitans sp. PhB188 TaxID=2485200 RepID=UPI000F49557F|nr:helix-turn-helix domain-containing protein [Frondihabitans sp. PhB188]ROQ36629.1 transcriptional regulator GlxA family with amidase domain [Frondihabitans sp. PhB188]